MNDEGRFRFRTDQLYFKSPEEMAKAFSAYPDAVRNTIEIASRCDLKLTFGKHHLPKYDVPEGMTKEEYLRSLCEDGLKRRFSVVTPEISKRLDHELKMIQNMGFTSYFLIVWDFIHYAKSRNIPVGPGRGSAAGSLVGYLLGITDIDPLRYRLLFERFLNPERISMPDIDVDFCYDGGPRSSSMSSGNTARRTFPR
jgi:DNA polymerase-3 subunit alpha